MPVSHLGLTVSHIPSATSFYLAALQPLGYRFIGHQGDSIGFGVDSADFFLTQAPVGTRPSPNHIAFLADSRLVVRDCYAAALTSGGLPNGAPGYRNDDCSCFNAAVEDLDGNTVEFVHRQPHGEGACCGQTSSPEGSRVLDWQKDVPLSANDDDARSVAQSMVSRGSLASKTSRAKSRVHTALDLASATSNPAKAAAPSQSTNRTQPKSDIPSKALIGTALGAAAGAALVYAMTKSEMNNAREEADHLAYMASKSRRHQSVNGQSPRPKAETVREAAEAPKPETRIFHRNYSTTESAFSKRQPPPPTQAIRMIEATGHNRDDEDVQEVVHRYKSLRPQATRSRTHDDYESASTPNAAGSTAPPGHSMKHASTVPVEQTDRPNYYLEAPPPKTSRSRHSTRQETSPKSTVSHSSRHIHRHSSVDEQDLERRDSGISVHSHRSRREKESDPDRRSSASKASTIKPSRQEYENTAAVTAEVPLTTGSRAASSCYYPAAISLPASKASSRVTTGERERSHASSRAAKTMQATPKEPLVPSKESWEDFVADESDGMGDMKTVLPDDSISVVDLKKPRRKHHSKRSGSPRRSEASTVKPARKEGDGTASTHRSRKQRSVHA